MRRIARPLRAALAFTVSFALASCATTTTVSTSAPTEYTGPQTASGRPLLTQLQWAAQDVNPGIVFIVGDCQDKTGKYADAEALRYSRAMTQACEEFLGDVLRAAGFQVAERNQKNMALINQEYALSHQPMVVGKDAKGKDIIRNGGLIQWGPIPEGGVSAGNVLVSGSFNKYESSATTSGGGVDVDGIGASVRKSTAEVGVNLRFVEVASSLWISRRNLTTRIEGTTRSFHVTRFLGEVASTLVSAGPGSASVTRPSSDAHIASAEFGGSENLSVDDAALDAIIANLAMMLEENQARFYTKPVKFDYNVAATETTVVK